MAAKYPSIPDPTPDPKRLNDAVSRLKEGFETITNQRGDPMNSAVTWADLVRLNIVTPNAVPKKGQ